MIQRFLWGTLYGLAYTFITGSVLFAVLDTWPTPLMWLKIGTGLIAQFGLGIFTFMKDPERAWALPPGVKAGLFALPLVLLAACTTLDGLKEVTLADAQQSLVWAEEDQDLLASTCYSALVDILQTANLPNLHREPVGVLSTVYLARSVRRDIESLGTNSLRTKFLLGCAPLVSDQRDVLLKLGIKVAPLPLP